MRKAMQNTLFGTALVAALMAAGTAANAQRPGGFEARAPEARGDFGRGYDRPAVHQDFNRGDFNRGDFNRGYAGGGFVRPVGPAYPVGPRVGFGVSIGVPAPVVDETYIPPCPGDGYDWIAGYYDGGAWIPGAWRLRAGDVAAPRPYVAYGRPLEGHGFEGRGFHGGFNGRR